MTVPEPKRVVLTPDEQILYDRIKFFVELHFEGSPELFADSSEAADALVKLLAKRGAIPQIRLDYFGKPEYSKGQTTSYMDKILAAGAGRDELFQSPSFLPYLHYFIHGPDLPQHSVDGFREILIQDHGTSGMVREQLRRFVQKEIRESSSERSVVKKEFFKLALECGLEVGAARELCK